jgi:hypothetical protein
MADRTGILESSPSWRVRGLPSWLDGLRRSWRRSREVALGVALSDGGAWSRRIGAGGVTVRCVAGSALLTREGDPDDHVLVGGDAFRSERPGRLALMALDAADVTVTGDLR